MVCWECNQRPTYNFGALCKECKDVWDKHQDEQAKLEEEDEKHRTWNGSVYSGECMCGDKSQIVWLIQCVGESPFGKGAITGAWCENCIYAMTGIKQVQAIRTGDERLDFSFRDIENIQFIKKLREPKLDQTTLDVIEVLKAVDF